MGREGLMREILVLLRHHGLEDDADRLKSAGRSPETVLDVLLNAYRKTCDAAVFSLFVTMTWPLMVSRARRILKRENRDHMPEKAISSAYAFIVKETLSPRSSAAVRIWKQALEVLELRLLGDGAEASSSRQAAKNSRGTRFREMT